MEGKEENDQPTREKERQMRGFKNVSITQEFCE